MTPDFCQSRAVMQENMATAIKQRRHCIAHVLGVVKEPLTVAGAVAGR